ncbi:hypothetical protein Petty_29 [Acinetobacter phage Petty]|uniref:Uncharacterized protein n=1 Tax=Acinetobacter phage Petty TaxID=1406779 RepID=U5PW88_9CAUD|nr:hypothetical protein Petty_29 [Acinetobacter phage Petty]AGY48001.1 hypothetical protein Petty_29 [Acinetobacter phage Petty]
MGMGSKLKKLVKKGINSLFGVGAMKDMAAAQEAQLRQQTEAAKLNSMNEIDNVTQFSDNTAQFADFGGGDNTNRRKKRSAGAFSSGIGLQV